MKLFCFLLAFFTTSVVADEVTDRVNRLKYANQQLKKEFIGIDRQIDHITQAIRSWYVNPEVLDAPTIVNLWGMTGTGKTSVVRRLMELLDRSSTYREVNMGSLHDQGFSFRGQISEMAGRNSTILLDEWQHARTIDEYGREIRPLPGNYQEIFSLLSDGKIRYELDGSRLADMQRELREALQHNKTNPKEPFQFYTGYRMGLIASILSSEGKSHLELQMDFFNDPVAFSKKLLKAIQSAPMQKEMSFSKSLIFVAGNLDSAYGISGETEREFLTADEMHRISTNVSLSDIMKALRTRFRMEQIARQGSTHVIYPSLSEDSFRKLIKVRLNHISNKNKKKYGLRVIFSDNIVEMIYREGVIPALGTRPVLTAISSLIENRLPDFLTQATLHQKEKGKKTTKVRVDFDFKNYDLTAKGYARNLQNPTFSLKYSIPSRIDKDRKTPHPEPFRTRVAVHEAGHAVVGIILERHLPVRAVSKVAAKGTGGFVKFERPTNDMDTRRMMMNDLAVSLAGHVAEREVFGKENVSGGASSDLDMATKLASRMVREWALGEQIAQSTYNPQNPHKVFAANGEDTREIESMLKEMMTLARETLLDHKPLFVAITEKLREKTVIDQKELGQLVDQHVADPVLKSQILGNAGGGCHKAWESWKAAAAGS